jgi:hypothetical protein
MFITIGHRAYNKLIYRSPTYYGTTEYLIDLTKFLGLSQISATTTNVALISKNGQLIPCVYSSFTEVDEVQDFKNTILTFTPMQQ